MKSVDQIVFLVALCNILPSIVLSLEGPEVQVYYESLCPDSRYFVTRVLSNTLNSFTDLKVKYIPFGKANSNGVGGFDCQHGPLECYGNIVQSCGLARLPTGKPQQDFVYCSMLNPKQYQRCAEKSGLSWLDIESCAQSAEGNGYHRVSEGLTKSNTDGPTFVPSIAFNNVFSKTSSTEAFNDLTSHLCANYLVQHPSCSQSYFG